MTISKLSEMTILSPNHCDGRYGKRVCKFTPHYMAGDLTIEQCGSIFVPESRKASSNYGIGSDGRIACYVDEDNGAWTSSSRDNDRQAITVEVANLDNETGTITNEAWESLVKLATDVCHRYKFRLKYTGDPSGSLTHHDMFSATNCPGDWLRAHMQELADTVNHNLDTGNFSYSGIASSGGVVTDLASAYGAGINAKIFPSEEEVKQFFVTLDEKSGDDIDLEKLKAIDVSGACIDMGSYFDELHSVRQKFRNPKLDTYVKMCKEAKLPFALCTTIRARNLEEAAQEMHEINLAVRKYPPQLGLWLKIGFNKKKEINEKIIEYYEKQFVKLGLKDQIGFYDTKDHLDLIKWDDHLNDWYWWMDKHLKSVDNIYGFVSPKFFMYENPDDELYTPNYSATLSFMGGGGGQYVDDKNATAIQKKVADIAENSSSVCLEGGWCAQFVSDVYQQAGLTRPGGNAIDFWRQWSGSGSTDKQAPMGSVVVGSGYGQAGSVYGHVGVVLSGGRVAENIGGRRVCDSIDAWASGMNATCDGHTGYIGWVWPNGEDLSKIKS